MSPRVLLVYPRIDIGGWGGYGDPPLGVLYLATFLRRAGVHCDVIDATFMRGWDEFERELEKHSPDVVGLSFSSPIAHLGFTAAELAKRRWPEALTVAGGPHPTVAPEQTLDNDFIDAVIIGEGEIALAGLVQALSAGESLATVPGLWYKSSVGVRRNQRDNFIADLDSLPFPDRRLIDTERYIMATRTIPIHVARGCPFKCLFCQPTQKKLFGPKVRFRSAASIVAEMLALRADYPQNNYAFSFQADTFTVSSKWTLDLCRKIVANNLQGVPWIAESRVNTIEPTTAEAMRQAGCLSLRFGIESGSQRVLDFLEKGITVEQSRDALDVSRRHGIIPQAYIMTGIPTETEEDLEKTCELVRDARPAFVNISRATPVPGSRLHGYVTEKGISNINGFADFDYYHNDYPIRLEHLTREDLQAHYSKMMRTWVMSFIRHPSLLVLLARAAKRFPGYRLFFVGYLLKGLRIGTTGSFIARMAGWLKRPRFSRPAVS